MSSQAYCPHCQATRHVVVDGFPHVAHVALCIVSCGLWSPVYAIAYACQLGGRKTCHLCRCPVH